MCLIEAEQGLNKQSKHIWIRDLSLARWEAAFLGSSTTCSTNVIWRYILRLSKE